MRRGSALCAALLALCTAAIAGAGKPGPLEVVAGLQSHWASVTDYQCVMESEVHGPEKTAIGTYRIWFCKPELFRLKVEQGRHHGSEIALDANGKLKARPRGFLGRLIVAHLDRNDPRLQSPRGGYPWDSNFGTLFEHLREHIRRSSSSQVVREAAHPGEVRVVAVFINPDNGRTDREVWTVDTGRWTLTALDIFEDGTQVERVRFRDYVENPGLSADFFHL